MDGLGITGLRALKILRSHVCVPVPVFNRARKKENVPLSIEILFSWSLGNAHEYCSS